MAGIPTKIKAFDGPYPQPDAPHMANHELELANQTAALAYRLSGSTRTYCYLDPVEAPWVEVSADETWSSFNIGNLDTSGSPLESVTYELPWLFTENFGGIQMDVYLVMNHAEQFDMRFQVDTLIDAVAGAPINSAISKVPEFSLSHIIDKGWTTESTIFAGGLKYVYHAKIRHTGVVVPAGNRRIKLVPQIYRDSPTASISAQASTTQRIHIKQITVRDIPQDVIAR